MKFSYIFAMLIFVFGIWACKGKTQEAESKSISKSTSLKIVSVSYGSDPKAIKWYEYNDQGDIIRQALDIDTIVYEYSVGKIVKRHLDKTFNWHSATEYKTDPKGRVIMAEMFDENDKKVSSAKYTYNQEGYLINVQHLVHHSGSQAESKFEYDGGNLVKVNILNSEGKLEISYVYEYYQEKVNILNIFMESIADDILPNERMGKRNKNLVKQMSSISQDGDTLSLIKYNYGDVKNGILTCVQIDDLNEFEVKILYHLK